MFAYKRNTGENRDISAEMKRFLSPVVSSDIDCYCMSLLASFPGSTAQLFFTTCTKKAGQ